MAFTKPDLTRVWANGAPSGNVIDPDLTTPGKFAAGWQAEVPPFEHFNFIQKMLTQGLAYNNQQGINVWDSATTYPVNGLTKSSLGNVFRALTENTDEEPEADDGTNWVLMIPSISSTFANIDDAKKVDLQPGMIIKTNAYRAPVAPLKPKGGATYLVMSAVDFGGTPDEYGDHTLDNGNILVLDISEGFKTTQFGCYADGVNNDTEFCKALALAVEANDGGFVDVVNGVYLVGDQEFTGAADGRAYRGSNVFSIQNCNNPVYVECNNSKFKYIDGYRFGSFDPVTGLAYTAPSLPFTNQDYLADMGYIFLFRYNKNVIVKNYEFDGNSDTAVLGGQWGDTGYQCIAYGLWAYNNESFYAENVNCHHSPLDGVAIGFTGLTEDESKYPHTLINVTSEYNSRQGMSVVGCNQLVSINCNFNHTGKGAFASAPTAGVDLEAESSINRNMYFLNCEMKNNAGVGMVADSGDSRYATFDNCFIHGTTNWAIWPRKPDFTFRKCTIVGRFVNSYTATDGSATVYEKCTFTDEAKYGDSYGADTIGAQLSATSSLTGVKFNDCTFNATRMRPGRFDNANLKDCIMNISNGTTSTNSGDFSAYLANATVTNLTINENITANVPANAFYIYTAGLTSYGKNIINSISGNNKVQWVSATGGVGILGQMNNSQAPQQYQSIISGRGFSFGAGFFGVQQIFSYTSAPPTSGALYQNGDICWNKNATVDANNMLLIGWYAVGWSGGTGTWVPMYVSTVSPAV